MSDFSSISLQANTGASDSTVTWTSISFSGSGGLNEIRFCASGAGAATTGSASWPYYTRPTSGTAVIPEAWAFTSSDNTGGLKINTYTGTNAAANVFRYNWDNTGTMASAPQITAYANSSHTAPSAGTQPPGSNNDAITNGSTDTSNYSYLKGCAYGTLGTGNLTAGTSGTGLSVTAGAAGAVTTSSGAWTAWTGLQGALNYLQFASTPPATTANAWNFSLALYTGVTMSTGAITPVLTLQYTYV